MEALVRGAVFVASVPLTTASESKARPVVLIASEDWDNLDALLTVLSISSAERRLVERAAGDLVIADWADAGLSRPSIVQTHRIHTIQGRYLQKYLGVLNDELMSNVRSNVAEYLGINSTNRAQ